MRAPRGARERELARRRVLGERKARVNLRALVSKVRDTEGLGGFV